MKKIITIYLLALITMHTSPYAEDKENNNNFKIPIMIDNRSKEGHITNDNLIYLIKEIIRKSSTMTLTTTPDHGDTPTIIIHILTLPKEKNNSNSAIIYSITWTLYNPLTGLETYLSSTVGYGGAQVLQEAAYNIISSTDPFVDNVKEAFIAIMKNNLKNLNKKSL